MLQIENIKKIYNSQSRVYDFLFRKFFFPRQRHVIETMSVSPGQKVLDVGVGTGMSLPVYPGHCDVTGIDLSSEMLAKAREKVKKLGLVNVTLKEMDASNLQFEDNTFDYVVATFIISVVPDPVKVIAEMKRVCKKDGRLIIVNHFKSSNPIVAKMEKIINPITCKIGWRMDVCLNELIEKSDLHVNERYKLKKLDLWNVVFATNNKVC